MSRSPHALAGLRLLAGSSCLDFANTVEPRQGVGAAHDYLQTYSDLVQWGRHAGLIDTEVAEHLERRATAVPNAAKAVFRRAIVLREAVYSVFRAIGGGAEPLPTDLLAIGRAHSQAVRGMHLTWNGAGATWQPTREGPALDFPLFLVVRSAIELLATLPAQAVKCCPGAGDCGWLFLDQTKNRSRVWCRSDGCGARVKMRRRYHRSRHE